MTVEQLIMLLKEAVNSGSVSPSALVAFDWEESPHFLYADEADMSHQTTTNRLVISVHTG